MKKVIIILLLLLAVLCSLGIVRNDGDVFATFDRIFEDISSQTTALTDFISDVFGADFYVIVSKRSDVNYYLQIVVRGIDDDYAAGRITADTRHSYRSTLNSYKYKFDADVSPATAHLQASFDLNVAPLNLYLTSDQLHELCNILNFRYYILCVVG